MTIKAETLAKIKSGIESAGSVYILYNGELRVIRSNAPSILNINHNHLIGVYNAKAAEFDIFDDIITFIDEYNTRKNKQSRSLAKAVGMAH
jgi:hypothetical protein